MFAKKNIIKTFILFVFFVLIPVWTSTAQMLILDEFLVLNLKPKNPAPLETVLASVEMNLTDLKRANISWFLNGELAKSGIGETEFEFESGQLGELTRLVLELTTLSGQKFRREVSMRSAEVDLIWNAETYTPPFYKGRAIFTDRSEVSISALPIFLNSSGQRINPQNLFFRWYRDNAFLQRDSGLGKDKITISTGPITRPLNIKVEVSNSDGSIRAEKSARIVNSNPQVIIYEDSPLYGLMLNRAVLGFELKDREITLSAVPYFFSASLKNSNDLEYSWRQRGQSAGNRSSLTLRKEGQITGQAEISLSVRHKNKLLQTGQSEIILNLTE